MEVLESSKVDEEIANDETTDMFYDALDNEASLPANNVSCLNNCAPIMDEIPTFPVSGETVLTSHTEDKSLWPKTLLTHAATKADVATILSCLNQGADINRRDATFKTPLMTAIYSDHLPVVELLLSSVDLDLSVVNKFGQTALHYACFMDNPQCVSVKIVE